MYKFEIANPDISIQRQWEIANDICLQTLLHNGAVWGAGPKSRGQLPTFRKRVVFPGQTTTGVVRTKFGDYLHKTIRICSELVFRCGRIEVVGHDSLITRVTLGKLFDRLHFLEYPFLWLRHSVPQQTSLCAARSWLQQLLNNYETQKKCRGFIFGKPRSKTRMSKGSNMSFIT